MNDNTYISKVIDNLQKGIYVVDSKKNYVYSNDIFLRMVGVSREHLIGHNVYEFRDKGKYDTCVSDSVFREKNSVSLYGNIVISSNGVIRNERLMINATPIMDKDENIEFVFVECELVCDMNSRTREATVRNLSCEHSTFNTQFTNRQSQSSGHPIIANSLMMRKVLSIAENVAKIDATVLISGASGTGKELIAEYIHEKSNRKDHPMIIINCASVPENLLESVLFGYEKGSFSGGLPTGKKGLIEEADKGTLFLDEINSLPLGLQGKLLRVIETKKIQRIGSSKEISVDFRLLVATNENLKQKLFEGAFRSDLYYRINVLPVNIPTLAERREDIIPITEYYNEIFCEKYRGNRIFSSDARDQMLSYDWPGNIRELRNAVERAVIMTDHEHIDSTDMKTIIGMQRNESIPNHMEEPNHENDDLNSLLNSKVTLQKYLDECEKKYLSAALSRYGSTYKVASALKTNQSLVMRRKIKYDL